MTFVTVGVPVFNGADQLRESLECLLSQSHADIHIRIYDNASTDATPDIAREFERRDSRVTLVRHPENIRAMPNFLRIVQDCETPYVMWRAHDDLSSQNYIETLLSALQSNPKAHLAIPIITSRWNDGSTYDIPPTHPTGGNFVSDTQNLLMHSHPAWFYGLWSRDALLPVFDMALRNFPVGWAFDHLVLFPFLINRRTVAASEATFIHRLFDKSYKGKPVNEVPLAVFKRIYQLFFKQCLQFINESDLSIAHKLYLKLHLRKYTDIKVYKIKKIKQGKIFKNGVPASIASSEF